MFPGRPPLVCTRVLPCVTPSAPVLYISGKALGVNQCKLGGEIFLSCRVGIFYRLKVDQFFNTFKRENYVYTHENIYIYVCILYKYWSPAFLCQAPALMTRACVWVLLAARQCVCKYKLPGDAGEHRASTACTCAHSTA